MNFRRVSYIIIAVGIVVVACAAWFLYSRHEAQAAAVRERFRQLDAAYSKRNKLVISLRADRSQVTALLNDGFDASRRRHDEADSLSLDDMAALARKEKKDYEHAQSVQTKLENDDEAVSAIYSELYGADAHSEITTTLRTYAHTIKGAGKDAVRKIDEQLAKAYGNRMATAEAPDAQEAGGIRAETERAARIEPQARRSLKVTEG